MPPKSVSTGRNPTKQMSTPIVQPATSSRSKSNQNRLEKQDSIHESSKLLNKKSKTEKSLEVPVTTTRRYSLPTAQIIEEAKENAYLKKTQQQRQGGSGGGGSESRYVTFYTFGQFFPLFYALFEIFPLCHTPWSFGNSSKLIFSQ